MKKKKKVKIKNPIENFDFMKTNKDNIKNIIKDNTFLPIINELVDRTNKIVIHSYQFLKLYLLNLYYNNNQFPLIDKQFITDIFKVITIRKCKQGNISINKMPIQLKELQKFYNKEYSKTNNDINYYDKLSYILAYEAIDMITNINNNITEHFISRLSKYIHIKFKFKEFIKSINDNIEDEESRKLLKKYAYNEINKIIYDITSFDNNLTSNNKYHKWILNERKNMFPYKSTTNKNVYYDLKVNPMDYLYAMFYINDQYEAINELKQEDEYKIKLFNVLPLRTNIIKKHICIDTCALISNFLQNEPTTDHLKNYKENDNQYNLWNRFFRLNKKIFKKKNYNFNYMIRTDGISSCILFIRVDNNNKPLTKKFKHCSEEINTDYIEKTNITDQLKKMKVVVADPGYSDLIYCASENNDNKIETFRYTQNQRRLETRNKKYNKIINKINNETKINNKTIKEHETVLSNYNSKTVDYNKFKNYCIEKNKLNNNIYEHYQQPLFRKLKFNRFINSQKSESKLIKNFSNKFGKANDTIFIIGDYDKGDYNMKGCEPAICKKFRRIFKNAGYKTYLINEYKTSQLCNNCLNKLEKFKMKLSKKPKNKNKEELCNGLLRCKSVKPKCEIIHNRDKNACINMLNIVKSVFQTGKRPKHFIRDSS